MISYVQQIRFNRYEWIVIRFTIMNSSFQACERGSAAYDRDAQQVWSQNCD